MGSPSFGLLGTQLDVTPSVSFKFEVGSNLKVCLALCRGLHHQRLLPN